MEAVSLGRGICVVVPTYNNAITLPGVLDRIQALTGRDVIVVNDGSTDATRSLLDAHQGVRTIHLERNMGKGHALRAGFAEATRLGYTHAITIDSDGQHDPTDLTAMAAAVLDFPNAMVMGARNMDQDEVPGRSSFGNRFSNFWFKVATGISLPDTQTGFRGWPLEEMKKVRTMSDRFGFEVESIVKLAWRGTPFKVVPVSVRYDFPGRVSHFKPFLDFARISVLNTWLVTVALLWYWPRRWFVEGGLLKLLRAEAIRPNETSWRKALSLGFGLFMGIVPIWGFQLLAGIPLAMLFRLNRVLFIAGAHISLPPMIPFILFASYLAGAPFMEQGALRPTSAMGLTLDGVHEHLRQYLIGACVLALTTGVLGALVAYALLRVTRGKTGLRA